MSEAIDVAREGSLAGWPFWASVLTHIVGLGAVSAVAVLLEWFQREFPGRSGTSGSGGATK